MFDCEEDAQSCHKRGQRLVAGDVVVIRYEGPKRRTRYARNAQSDIGHNGHEDSEDSVALDYRRPIQRGNERMRRVGHILHRRRHAGGLDRCG